MMSDITSYKSSPLKYIVVPPSPSVSEEQGECITFPEWCRPVFVLEKHMSVIRKGPTQPPQLQMYKFEEETALVSSSDAGGYGTVVSGEEGLVKTSFLGSTMWQSSNHFLALSPQLPNTFGTGPNNQDISSFYNLDGSHKKSGDTIIIPIDLSNDELDWAINDQLLISHTFSNSFGVNKKAVARVSIDSVSNPGSNPYPFPNMYIMATIIAITGNFPKKALEVEDIYNVALVQNPALFKHKFPRFSYRYKYEDGEYSVFAPWSELAFIPETYDYLPKKGYNLGMENAMRSLRIMNFVPKDIPKDVIQVDLLYKESNSPTVYTVASFKQDDPPEVLGGANYWNTLGTGDNKGSYKIKSELIHKVVPSNQMLRPWDNVPKKALAQEITANRLIYANYVQNYNMKYDDGGVYSEVIPKFSVNTFIQDHSIDSLVPNPGEPAKSLKSMRTYQLGIVYRDRYGRETPVMTDKSGSFKLDKSFAKFQSRLKVKMESQAPYWAESYTFYIKEASNEYYNLAMDRWYDAEDGGIWLSFPSSERNKVSDRTTLILKKQHDSFVFTEDKTRYKILSIKNDAPTFIKTDLKYWGSLPVMLPPPGWGVDDQVGGWDTGMFFPTGLPLINRMFLDIYAEYWDQSVMRSLSGKDGAQVRISQSAGQASAYNAGVTDNTNKSHWYNVANIEYIGAPAQTFEESITDANGVVSTNQVEVPAQMEQLVRISLEKPFGTDIEFCNPEDNLSLSRGLSLEARTKDVKDRAQFEGRFFVKVLRDYNVDQNIVNPQQDFKQQYQVLQSKDLRYISAAHPGKQDWNNAKYFPISYRDLYGMNTYFNTDQVTYSYNGTVGMAPAVNVYPVLVSSLSANHSGKLASYMHYAGTPELSPLEGGLANPPPGGLSANKYWPHEPGSLSIGVFDRSYWNNFDYLSSAEPSPGVDWPSFGPKGVNDPNGWWPAMCYEDCVGPNFAGTLGPHISTLNVPWIQESGTVDNPYKDNSTVPSVSGSVLLAGAGYPRQGFVDLLDAYEFQSSIGNDPLFPNISFGSTNWMPPANPIHVPAIWGEQDDFVSSTGISGTNAPKWTNSTIDKLKRDWHLLWMGREKLADEGWPLGRFHPNRWIIDKAGAAQGHSGNGIWDDGNVGYMDVSYWGIGSESEYNRKNTNSELMAMHQQTETAFAKAMSTVGTQFRFKQDPDQTVYTITNVQALEHVWNYECPRGAWGYQNPTTLTAEGGFGLGEGVAGPWGGQSIDAPLSGGTAFLSDLFRNTTKATGGAPYNRRMRFTLTLDKIIGLEGGAGFHPIDNHVDKDGVANIKGGRALYDTGINCAAEGITAEKGGTAAGIEMYNLSSYWNATATPTAQQLNTLAGQAAGQHIGLHERGLNETTIEIITPYQGDGESRMSDNPAVWETEPLEDVGLDIYYAASPSYPVQIERYRWDYNPLGPDEVDNYGANWYDYGYRGEEIIPVGSIVTVTNTTTVPSPEHPSVVCAVQNDVIWLLPHVNSAEESAFVDSSSPTMPITLNPGDTVQFSHPGEGTYYGAGYDNQNIELEIVESLTRSVYRVSLDTHNRERQLGYYNCYSYGTGVESNRVRDDFNAVTIDKGVKASMPLAEQYEEERKGSGLIFSGIYNSTSGVNSTNQFIQAEPITKDLNPINGSIQKLFTRDTDLLTFCENKVFKILAKKDALFNADGNTNITSNQAVLGQTIPFSGEYGISKNPESFASESYRVYFADKARGSILRLSRDGLTPISDKGMKDWFKDNLMRATSIIGSHDDREEQYNITIETSDDDRFNKAYTLSYTESRKGWVSFKSFITQGGISHKNTYYTFPSNNYSHNDTLDPWGIDYNINKAGFAETWQHHIDTRIRRFPIGPFNNTASIAVNNDQSTLIPGMNIVGDGIQTDTEILTVDCSGVYCQIVTTKVVSIVSSSNPLTFTMPRNSYYGKSAHYSMLKVLFNRAQGSVKRFKTLDYEGTQARVIRRDSNTHSLYDGLNQVEVGQIHYDNISKAGWFVKNMFTDMQQGKVPEFLNKENKWYNFIRGYGSYYSGGLDIGELSDIDTTIPRHDSIDTAEFSLQGLGFAGSQIETPVSWDCDGLGNCSPIYDGSGEFISENACQFNCPDPSWICNNGACTEVFDGSGPYTNKEDCEYWCPISGSCHPCDDTSGGITFTMLENGEVWYNSTFPVHILEFQVNPFLALNASIIPGVGAMFTAGMTYYFGDALTSYGCAGNVLSGNCLPNMLTAVADPVWFATANVSNPGFPDLTHALPAGCGLLLQFDITTMLQVNPLAIGALGLTPGYWQGVSGQYLGPMVHNSNGNSNWNNISAGIGDCDVYGLDYDDDGSPIYPAINN